MFAKSRLLWIALAATLMLSETGRAQERPLVIRAATLIDGKGGVTRNVSIVVQGSHIARIDANTQGTTYDLKGLTVMPGWIDTHVHMDAHFDPNGKIHSPASAKNETPQQTMLYAVENAYNVLMAGLPTATQRRQAHSTELRRTNRWSASPG